MSAPVYLIRHAQSHPSTALPDRECPLSQHGSVQAEQLAPLLQSLKMAKVFSSPYVRCQRTIGPFAEAVGLEPIVDDKFRERTVALELREDFPEIWTRSWQDFSFALPGCETSLEAQRRFVGAVHSSALQESHAIGICTHGNVIGLLMNCLDPRWGREQTDRLRNPYVLRLTVAGGALVWDQDFRLPGLDQIASGYHETPIDW